MKGIVVIVMFNEEVGSDFVFLFAYSPELHSADRIVVHRLPVHRNTPGVGPPVP